ncbi:DMT family transporter [Roseibium suaedae]|uniref:Threonine/homoserine efflux transporter RhtA n=1 Tax=Roseibium suaedae TaxID=735517 RepID=A0A1M7HJD2_9HYPH|nr:DMT family transporter [Roseibium suaedae]SHM28651.1 Threonine/homoserine efflux transporter RhtA [Roseibium suaedae]
MNRLTANSLLLLAAALWGSAFVAQSTAMEDVGPFYFTGIRFLIAALVLAPFAWRERTARRNDRLTQGHLARFGLIGAVFFLGIVIQQIGMMTTTVTNTAFLTSLYVVLVPVIGFALFRDIPHPVIWPAAFAALTGIWLLGGASLDTLNWGDGAVLVCAVFWALHVALLGHVGLTSGRPLALAFSQFLIAGLAGVLCGLATEEISFAQIQAAGFELFYTSVVSGCLAFTLQAVAQRWTRAADAAILLASEALFGAMFGAILLGERLGGLGLVGCALILLAIVSVQLVPLIRRPARA